MSSSQLPLGRPATGDSPPTVTTRQLLTELGRGSSQAAEKLVEKFRPGLMARASRHPWMQALAAHMTVEDIVQEVFSRALSSGLLSVREGRVPGSLRRALHVVLDRVLRDQLRASGALKRGADVSMVSIDPASDETGNPLMGQLASSETTPTVNARSAELIRLCQEHLADNEWEIWRLRVVAGLGFEEIAALTAMPTASARGVMHRARKKLILALADLDPDVAID